MSVLGATLDDRGSGARGRRAAVPAGVIRSAAVGAGLGAVLLVGLLLPWDSFFDSLACHDQEPWGCLGLGLLLFWLVPPVLLLVGWLLLRLAKVRPAWRVAAVGGLIAFGAGEVYERVFAASAWAPFALVPALAAAYAAAAFLVLPGVAPVRHRLVFGAVLLLLWPLSGALQAQRVDDAAEQRLAEAEVPLLAPDVPGYRIFFPDASRYEPRLSYLLLPSGVATSAPDREARGVRVTVGPQLPDFAPPASCHAVSSSGTFPARACEQVAPGTWRAASPYGATWYFVQREGAVALLATDGPLVAEGDLKTIAASLAVRSPRFLLGG